MEQKDLNFQEICELDNSFDDLYIELIDWHKSL